MKSSTLKLSLITGLLVFAVSGCSLFPSIWTLPQTYRVDLTFPFVIQPPSLLDLRTAHIVFEDEAAGISGEAVRHALENTLRLKQYTLVDDPAQASYRIFVKLQGMVRSLEQIGTREEKLLAISGSLETGGGYQALGFIKTGEGLIEPEIAVRKASGWADFFFGENAPGEESGLQYYLALFVHLKIDEHIRQSGREQEILASEDPLALTGDRYDAFISTLVVQTTTTLRPGKDEAARNGITQSLQSYLGRLF